MRLRLSLLMFLQYAPAGAVLPIYSVWLTEELGFTAPVVALCCATQAIAVICTSMLAGQVADRWVSAERCLAACALLSAIDLWALADLGTPAAVGTATFIFWLLCGPTMMLGIGITFTHLPHPERQYGGVRLWGTVGWMATGWLVGWWFSNPAWLRPLTTWLRPEAPAAELSDALRIGAAMAFLLAVYALTLPHTPPARSATTRAAPLAALRQLHSRPFVVYCLCLFGICVTMSFTTQATPLLLKELGIPKARLSPTLTIGQVSEAISLALLPAFLLQLGTRGTMLLGLAAWATALTALAIGQPIELVVSSLCLHGLCISGFFVAGQVFVNRKATGDLRASAQGLLITVNGMGMLVGHLLVGWLREASGNNLPRTFAVAAAIAGVLVLVFLIGFRESE